MNKTDTPAPPFFNSVAVARLVCYHLTILFSIVPQFPKPDQSRFLTDISAGFSTGNRSAKYVFDSFGLMRNFFFIHPKHISTTHPDNLGSAACDFVSVASATSVLSHFSPSETGAC